MQIVTRQVEGKPLTVTIEYPQYNESTMRLIQKINSLDLKFCAYNDDKQIRIELTDEARESVVDGGYDPAFGARPLKRAIQTHIEDGVCELLLSGDLKPGCTIRVEKDESGLKFNIND